MTVKIDRHAGKAPRAIVDALVGVLSFPLVFVLTHKNDKPLVVPSSGINTPIEPETETPVKVKSRDQVWMLVSDLSEFAHRAGNDSDDFAVLKAPSDEGVTQEAPQPPQGAAENPAPADLANGGVKPGRTKESK